MKTLMTLARIQFPFLERPPVVNSHVHFHQTHASSGFQLSVERNFAVALVLHCYDL